MLIIYTVGLVCCDKFEQTPDKKVVNMSKLTKPYFKSYETTIYIIHQKIIFGYMDF